MKLAVMQPYFFPYIGYFQLVNAVDKFIFYDDVNYIKNGWINRNRILINQAPSYLTLQLKGASPFKHINEIEISNNAEKLKKTIFLAYKKAPFFDEVFPLIETVLNVESNNLSDIAIQSIESISRFLDIDRAFERSGSAYAETLGLDREHRLYKLCKLNNAINYINPIGGAELYTKKAFADEGIDLSFLKSNPIQYKQFNHDFVPALSIIDVLMFNSKEQIKIYLEEYQLV